MKTIALSCAGEGFGHAARTVALAGVLRDRYRLVILCPPHLFAFMEEHLGNEVLLEPIPFFAFVKIRERVDWPRTFLYNLPLALRFPVAVTRIARRLRVHRAEALISDYDPFGAYAADRLGMPILQINHPSVVLRSRWLSVERGIARLISVILMGKYHRKVVVSFYDGDIGPVVRPAIDPTRVSNEDFYVVYLKPGYRKLMLRALKRLAITNVKLFPDPEANILDYLGRCKGVISSAGHQFMSEAIVLGKPVFVVPQEGQYEQMLNARMLELSGRGRWATAERLEEGLGSFIAEIDGFPHEPTGTGVRFRFDNDLPKAVDRIERFIIDSRAVSAVASPGVWQRRSARRSVVA